MKRLILLIAGVLVSFSVQANDCKLDTPIQFDGSIYSGFELKNLVFDKVPLFSKTPKNQQNIKLFVNNIRINSTP
ncbi:MAG: hypothetical protein ABL930_13565, partial [Pseudobdellovibrio sp.]